MFAIGCLTWTFWDMREKFPWCTFSRNALQKYRIQFYNERYIQKSMTQYTVYSFIGSKLRTQNSVCFCPWYADLWTSFAFFPNRWSCEHHYACIFGRVVKEEDGVTWVSWKLNSNNKTVEQLNSYLFADYNRDKMKHVKNFYYIYNIYYIYSNSKFYPLCTLHLINCSTVQLFNCSNIALSYKYYYLKTSLQIKQGIIA